MNNSNILNTHSLQQYHKQPYEDKDSDSTHLKPVVWINNPSISKWFDDNDCSLLVSSYNSHKILCIGVGYNSSATVTIWQSPFIRAMGLGYNNNNIFLSSFCKIHHYVNHGDILEKNINEQHVTFSPAFYPHSSFIIGDADIHDVRVNDSLDTYFVLAKYNCVATLSKNKSFEIVWVPPWITLNNSSSHILAHEDRCHLNGLCLVDNKPKFVTSASMTNYVNTWREPANQPHGIVFDIQKNEVYCNDIWSPHSPRMYGDVLYVLESGTGYFGYVNPVTKSFVQLKFIPGFLRGLDFINDYAVITSSLDRHDYAFKNTPLSDNLHKNNIESKCGIWFVNMNDFSIEHCIEFTGGVVELYDICILPNIGKRPRIINIDEPIALDKVLF